MWGWLQQRIATAPPEARWQVRCDGQAIHVTDPAGVDASIAIAELIGVVVRTTDDGPFATDVWWLLVGADGEVACRFPLGATRMDAALDRLGQLPGFDHGEMAMAMGSTVNREFLLWRREDADNARA